MPVSLKNNRPSGYQMLLYYKFIAHKEFDTTSIAEKMGISLDTLYRYIRGDRPFPVDRISDLVNATQDTEFLDYLCSPCGFSLMPKIKDRTTMKTFSQLVRMMQSVLDSKENSTDSDAKKMDKNQTSDADKK